MSARSAMPAEFERRAFAIEEARAASIPRSRLSASDLDRTFSDVRFRSGADLRTRAEAVLLVCVAGTVIGGPTAARLFGLPVPIRFARDPRVHLVTPVPGRAVRRRGTAARVLRLDNTDTTELGRLRLTTPARTWCDLAKWLTVPELVAIADRLPAARLRDALERHPGRRFHAKLRCALELRDPAAESPKESELRGILCLAGLPPLTAQREIFDERGRFVARVDLAFEEYRLIVEYQGDHHRTDQAQWRRDVQRRAELEALGYRVLEVTALDLSDPRALAERAARLLRLAGWVGTPAYSPHFPRPTR